MVVQKFTVKKMADITKMEDRIDLEYFDRVEAMKTRQEMIDLLDDYKEWLPEGLQQLREVDDHNFEKFIFQKNRIINTIKATRHVPMDYTEAYMICCPPMFSVPRGLSQIEAHKLKQRNPHATIIPMSFGQAFLRLKMEGQIERIQQLQETMLRKILEYQEKMSDIIDTHTAAPLIQPDSRSKVDLLKIGGEDDE